MKNVSLFREGMQFLLYIKFIVSPSGVRSSIREVTVMIQSVMVSFSAKLVKHLP